MWQRRPLWAWTSPPGGRRVLRAWRSEVLQPEGLWGPCRTALHGHQIQIQPPPETLRACLGVGDLAHSPLHPLGAS